jgi:hypothetical protein
MDRVKTTVQKLQERHTAKIKSKASVKVKELLINA